MRWMYGLGSPEFNGGNDPLTSADKERYFTSRYERKLLPGVGHFPQREAPDIVANQISAWLRN